MAGHGTFPTKSLIRALSLPFVLGFVNVRIDVKNLCIACLIHASQNDPAVDRWNHMVGQ